MRYERDRKTIKTPDSDNLLEYDHWVFLGVVGVGGGGGGGGGLGGGGRGGVVTCRLYLRAGAMVFVGALTVIARQKKSSVPSAKNESESEMFIWSVDPGTPAKSIAGRCRRGHQNNYMMIQYRLG